MNHLENYIVVIEKAVPHDLCDLIISEYKTSEKWESATIRGGHNSEIRKCETINLSLINVIEENKNTRQQIDHELFGVASKVINEYKSKFTDCTIDQDTGYELLRYETGCFYTEHTDSFIERPRSVSCSFALNDDYQGGEFSFFKGEVKRCLKKGDAILFPSNFMYPHEILPVTSGTRYSIVTWFV